MSAAFDELLNKYIELKAKYEQLSANKYNVQPQTMLTEPAPWPTSTPNVGHGYGTTVTVTPASNAETVPTLSLKDAITLLTG